MSFRSKMKKIDNLSSEEITIHPSFLSAQYNPDRFHLWKKSCVDVIGENNYLCLKYSPHVKLLIQYEENGGIIPEKLNKTPYYIMHKNYGKSNEWTNNKINTFIKLYNDIKINGINEPPIILSSPIEPNPYNDSYEIFEGHHRCSIYYLLDKKITCRIKKI